MRTLDSFSLTQSAIFRTFRDQNWVDLWKTSYPKWLPLILGLALGPVIAYLIVTDRWIFAVGLLLLVPLLILWITYPVATAAVWLLVMPFFVASPGISGLYVFWVFHRALVPLGLGVVLLSYLLRMKRYKAVRLGPAELSMAIFALLVPASILLFQPEAPRLFSKYYDRMLIPFIMYLLLRLTAPRERDMRGFLIAAAVVVLGQSIIGILSWFAPQVLPSLWLNLQGRRTTGSLGQPAVYTAALIFGIVFLYQTAMHRKPSIARLMLLLISGVGAICVFLSFSRGSWLGGIVVAFGLLVMFPKPTLRMAVIILVLMAFLGTSLLSDQLALASDRLETTRTIDSRIVLTDAMVTMVKSKPFFGWGYENLDYHIRSFLRRVGSSTYTRVDLTSHNTYLTIMTEMGLVGLFLYIFPAIWWLVLTIKVLPRMPKTGFQSRSFLIGLWLIIVNQIIVSSFIDMRFFPFGLTLWWMTLGLIAAIVGVYLKPDPSPTPADARPSAYWGAT
jgi:putative inorganic carbon (HCO3(-)) transporter